MSELAESAGLILTYLQHPDTVVLVFVHIFARYAIWIVPVALLVG